MWWQRHSNELRMAEHWLMSQQPKLHTLDRREIKIAARSYSMWKKSRKFPGTRPFAPEEETLQGNTGIAKWKGEAWPEETSHAEGEL